MASKLCVTWANSVPILVFLGFSVLDLGLMYATDRHQTASSLNALPRGQGIISVNNICVIDCILILHVHAESLRKDERHKMRRSMKWMVVKTIWLASSNIYL